MRRRASRQQAAPDPFIERHREFVSSMWNRPAPVDACAGLADADPAHPDFIARYEQIEKVSPNIWRRQCVRGQNGKNEPFEADRGGPGNDRISAFVDDAIRRAK